MLATLLAIPILGGLVLFHSAILSRTPLLQATPDLVLLTLAAWALQRRVTSHWQWALVGGVLAAWATALPFWLYPLIYLLTVGSAVALRRWVWPAPLLAMLITVFAATLLSQGLTVLVLWLNGVPLPVVDVLNRVTLPGLVLNLLLTAPVYLVMRGLANRLYPEELLV